MTRFERRTSSMSQEELERAKRATQVYIGNLIESGLIDISPDPPENGETNLDLLAIATEQSLAGARA